MNLLVVMRATPTPTTGANMRNLALLRALSQVSSVSLLIIADDAARELQEAHAIHGMVTKLRVVSATRPNLKRFYQLAGVLLGRSSTVWRYTSSAARAALREMLAADTYDAIYFEGIVVTGIAPQVGPRLIIDEHNLEWELLERSAQQASSSLRRLHDQREAAALRRVELATLGRADLVIVTSERERVALEKLLPGRRVVVVTNGVDIARFAPGSPQDELPGRVVFTGSMDYHPNEQAALFFAEQCWPVIHRARPDATWYVVGANPPASVWRLGELPGVTVTGSVPETRSYLAQAQVTIAPLLVGGGTRLKILEALAIGKTMVSTSIGYEGLRLVPDEHLLVADGVEAFAQAVIRALDDAALRARLGAAGREAVVSQYSWEQSGQTLQGAVASLAQREMAPQRAVGDR
ncbi:MAG TPA: glycosyltransferase [Ktedonobacterales bacterium]|jgi:glycosyltransferase involved in cell wall biosynthesis|nr:glycosyltransferase [Ktedonobacterales bacterium]